LPILGVRSRGSRGLQSFFSSNLGKIWASFLPSHPGCCPDLRVFGSTRGRMLFRTPLLPLLPFDATSASCPSKRRLDTGVSGRPKTTFSKHLASLLGPSACLPMNPFSSLFLSKKRPRIVTLIRESLAFRVWLPSGRPPFIGPGNLFQLPTLLGFPLQSFPLIDGSKKSFLLFFRSRASFPNLPAWNWRLSDFFPIHEPSPSLLPPYLQKGGGVCSLGLFNLSGLPSEEPPGTSLSSLAPFHPSHYPISQSNNPRILRSFSLRLGSLPP